MKTYLCGVCGHVAFEAAPEACPVCGAPREKFAEKNDLLKKAGDGTVGGETEKKHVPAITVVKTCGLIPQGCVDVHVKVGEIEHPSLPEHHITFIDFYLEKKYIARISLTPESCHPAGALHLKASSGTLQAIEHCNLHGWWFAEKTL
jgi:superoxide reductase